ncbi:UDP-glycosyltransferase 74E1-like [Euphorbia lathyris]|uniref:UDP-glycosyltransferase 74E1-like n=1 Tax=Euphorbia lathyris TaxID=212925 RepID=UPI0033142205
MEKMSKGHVLLIPYPAQGHINPMLHFCRRLASKSKSKALKITFLVLHPKPLPENLAGGSITVTTVCGSIDNSLSVPDHFTIFKSIMLPKLSEMIEKNDISYVVYDSFIPWVLDRAKELGVSGAPLFTQSCAVGNIYCNVYEERLDIHESNIVLLPGLPTLLNCELPSFLSDSKDYSALGSVIEQFSNLDQADCVFYNTFYSLENEIVNWMASKWAIKPIGPTIPSMFMDKRLEDDKDYGLSLFKPNSKSCMEWLDTKEESSVIYISFGSLAVLEEHQMSQLALGLKGCNRCFLWVVRESEETKLPQNFKEETQGKGLVVHWSPQLEVLAHKSVGCFVTHCGWNSTLEALSLGVPMVGMPQWTDQPTNAKFVSDVWGVGVRVKKDEHGIVTKDEIERCISEVMEGESGDKMRRNCEKWMKIAKMAVDEGGSSDRNIQEFVEKLVCN